MKIERITPRTKSMTTVRALALAGGLALLALGATPACAVDPVNANWRGIAIHGYDPVAYFDGAPAEGSSQHSAEWQGATWRFASAEHRDRFLGDPAKYAPQYGGYCAYAVAKGDTADIDPHAWKIVDGKLYLNYSKAIQAEWEKDIPGYIVKADASWPKLVADR